MGIACSASGSGWLASEGVLRWRSSPDAPRRRLVASRRWAISPKARWTLGEQRLRLEGSAGDVAAAAIEEGEACDSACFRHSLTTVNPVWRYVVMLRNVASTDRARIMTSVTSVCKRIGIPCRQNIGKGQ